MRADADGNGLIQTLEERHQLVGCEPAEMPDHQVRHYRLLDTEQRGDFPLLELPCRKQLIPNCARA